MYVVHAYLDFKYFCHVVSIKVIIIILSFKESYLWIFFSFKIFIYTIWCKETLKHVFKETSITNKSFLWECSEKFPAQPRSPSSESILMFGQILWSKLSQQLFCTSSCMFCYELIHDVKKCLDIVLIRFSCGSLLTNQCNGDNFTTAKS